MDLERKALICYSLGFIDATKTHMPRKDRMILLDQTLIKFNQAPMQPEEFEYIIHLGAEVDATLLTYGINREKVRSLTKQGKRNHK